MIDSIRRLRPAEAALYRDIRLEGLAQAPTAFGSTYEVESVRPLESFAERVERAMVLGAFAGPALLGVAGFYALEGSKEQHKGVLWGMYVRPAGRGLGVGATLAQGILDHAAGAVEQVLLAVEAGNQAARRLYGRLGFTEYGIEPRALRQGGAYFDEVLMVRFLGK